MAWKTKEQQLAYNRAYYQRNRDKMRADAAARYHATREDQAHYFRARKFGITAADFADMLDQQAGLCRICCEPMRPGKETHVDHDHVTGRVRGLLCHHCNRGLGCFRDRPEVLEHAAVYLG